MLNVPTRPGGALGPCALVLLAVVGCSGSEGLERVDDELLASRFEELHRAVHDVYAAPLDRDHLWSLLAGTFAGEALTDEYVEHFGTRTRMAADATSIQVLRVDYEDVRVIARTGDGVEVEADWSVGGVVTHQRHRHPRINRYRARFVLAPSATIERPSGTTGRDIEELIASLRIVETRLHDLERVKSALGSGGVVTRDALPESGGGFLTARDLIESGLLEEIESEAVDTEEVDPEEVDPEEVDSEEVDAVERRTQDETPEVAPRRPPPDGSP